jgi:hypothetical protein
MGEMKLIMERWNQFVEQSIDPLDLLLENSDKAVMDLKKDPKQALALVQQASKEKDKEKLAQLLRILVSDPEIKAAAEVMNQLPAEIEKQKKETPDLSEVEVLDKLVTGGILGTDEILNNPKVKKILPLGGITMLLGALAAALAGSPELGMMLFSTAGVAAGCAAGAVDCISAVVDAVGSEAAGAEISGTGRVGQE